MQGERLFEIINARDFREMPLVLSEDATLDFPKTPLITGRRRIVIFFKALFRRFPKLHFDVLRVISQGKWTAVHWRNKGVDRDQRSYENEGVTLIRMDGDTITEITDFFLKAPKSSDMFRLVVSHHDLIKVFIVRGIVFMEEQGVPFREEIDEYEYSSVHVLGEIHGEPAAAGRIRFVEDLAKLERLAIRSRYRKKGYGHRLVDYMMDVIRKNGVHKFVIHAQTHLTDFYGEHGFQVEGDRFEEAGIPHYRMVHSEDYHWFSVPVHIPNRPVRPIMHTDNTVGGSHWRPGKCPQAGF